MRITSLIEPKWTLQYAVAGSLRLRQGYEGGGSIAEGVTFSDGWVFYHQSRPGNTNGQVATQDEVFAAPPESEFCLVCHPCHDWLTVFVPAFLLFPLPPESGFTSSARPQLLKPPPHVTERFSSLVRRFVAAAESRPQLVDSPVAVESFQKELLAAAKELFIRNQHSTGRHSVRWLRLAKSAVELASSAPDLSLSISDLARTSGVPERTLRTAFQRCFGLSSVEFLRILRLHQARQRLLASCPDQTTVTQIAFGLGFWDLGRFAGAYRELFGELPSATLRKPSRTSASIRQPGYQTGAIDFNRVFLIQALQFSQQGDLVASRASAVLNLIAIYRALGGGWEIRLPHGGQGLPLEYTVTWEPVRPIGAIPEIEQPIREPAQPLEAVPTVPSEPRESQPSSADRERFRKLLERLQLDQQEREDRDVERQLEELLRRRDPP